MPHQRSDVLAALEQIAIASVAITTRAIAAVRSDLTFVQWRALVVVGDGDPPTVGDVAAGIGAHQSPASRLVGRLARRGLVEVVGGEADRRIRRVRLTEEGRRIRDDVLARRTVELRRIAAAWHGNASATTALMDLATAMTRELAADGPAVLA